MKEPAVDVTDVEDNEREAEGARLARYQEASTLPLLIASFLYVAGLIASLVDPDPFTSWIILGTWVVFIFDYAIQVWLAPVKWRFIARNLPYLFALVFPPLRMYLLLVISFRLFMNKNSSLRDRIGLAAGFAAVVIIVFGALLTFFFESGAKGANILTYGEALWWAAVTVTTVGYGDYTPVTVLGRLMGTVVFSTGLAVIAVLTGTIVGIFTDSGRQDKRKQKRAQSQGKKHKGSKHKLQSVDITDVISKLDEINARLIRLERDASGEHGAASRKLSAPRRTVLATEDREAQHSDPDHSRSSPATGAKASGEVPEDSKDSKPENPEAEDSKGDAD